MLGLIYRNLSEEQPTMARLYRKQKTRAVASAGFCFCIGTPYFNAACTNGGVTSTPVCSAAV